VKSTNRRFVNGFTCAAEPRAHLNPQMSCHHDDHRWGDQTPTHPRTAAAAPRERQQQRRVRCGRDANATTRWWAAAACAPDPRRGVYVLEGQLAFQVGTEVVTAGPGTWLFAPRDVPHTLANPGDQPGTLLCFFAPGGFERRFARALAQQAGEALPPDLEALSEAEHATRTVGPPLQF
jgi:hypothetical protein